MSGAVTKFSSHWRIAGLNYLEMINVASNSLRSVMKEPARTEALGAAKFHFRQHSYAAGVESLPCKCVECVAGLCARPYHSVVMIFRA
jgi:hypothetical protein